MSQLGAQAFNAKLSMFDASHTIDAMARTLCLLVAYDGTEFHGWQFQPGLRTVQGVLEGALQRVVRHPVDLIGSSRTDAGVHSAGHVSSFVTSCTLEPDRLGHAIGARLATDLAICNVREVHPDFNARRTASGKLYRYRIHNATRRPVERMAQRYAYHCWIPLDVERMRKAARYFVGTRNFSAMVAGPVTNESAVRTVVRCDVERHLDEIRIEVEGTGFLYKQVRTMVGTLINVGRGMWEPERVAEILESRDRTNAGPVAPAEGLCLQWVRYPPYLLVPPHRTDNTDKMSGTG